MTSIPSDIAFTPAVKLQQERHGSRAGYAKMEQGKGWATTINEDLAAFIVERDSFYLGTATADGQPYIQHRGGKAGFLKVIDDKTLAFADYSGNRQYISIGNLSENNKSFIFLMDYPNRRRVKIWGTAEYVENDSVLLEKVFDDDDKIHPERVFLLHVEAWDVNCPKHITPRFTEAQVQEIIAPLQKRIEEVEAQLEAG